MAEAAVSMVEVAAAFIAAAEASMVAADLMAVAIAGFVAAASMAARGLLAEEVATKVEGWEPATVQARREIGRRRNGRRMFVPQSTMASGIRSAAPVVPRDPAQGAIPEARRTQASLLATPEVPTDVGILLARQAALRNENEARPISAYPSAGASVGVVMVGGAVGGVTDGAAGGAGEVGALASASPTGVFIGDRPGRYGPYWYGAWPAYSYYPNYSYDWSDNPPPYRPNSSPNSYNDRDPSASLNPPNSDHSSNYSSDYDDNHFNLNPDSSPANNGSVEDGQTPQPEAAPNSPAPTAQSPDTPGLAVFEPWAPVPVGLI
jgi:hypothetical protein